MGAKTGGPPGRVVLGLQWVAALSAVIGVVLFARASHVPVFWRLFLLLPIILYAGLGLYLLFLWLSRRMGPGERLIWPDAAALLCVLLLLGAVGVPALLFLPLLIGAVFALVQLFRRRAGSYFVVFCGSALLFLLFSAARLLAFEERTILFLQRQWAARQAVRAGPVSQWAFDSERRALRVMLADGSALFFHVARDFSLHAPGRNEYGSDFPALGAPVVILSGSPADATATPVLAVFLPSGSQPHTPADFQAAVRFALGARRSQGTVMDPELEGPTELRGSGGTASFFGLTFGYRRLPDRQRMRETIYVTTGPTGRQLALLIREAVTPGLPASSATAGMLRSARWVEAAKPGTAQESGEPK